MQQRHIPAASIAVIKDGVVVRAGGYGIADVENNTPAHPETVYKIGSLSKQFIAAGIMLLAQDGKIAVDESAGRYIEGIPNAWQGITIRHLLTHTSGLVREGPGFDPYKIQPDLEVIRTAYALPLQFKPGERYQYSNLGYYVLAEIIHRVSGVAWDAFLKERVFAPLSMNATRATSVAAIVPNRAHGFVWDADKLANAEDWPAIRPSGAFLSTVADLAKWAAALHMDRVLTPASKAEMWKPVVLNDGKTYPYGFGWELDDFPPGRFTTGVPMIRHEGTIPGFRSAYGHFPKHGLTVVVLSNLDRAALDSVIAGIAVRYAPELMPAALRRWESQSLR